MELDDFCSGHMAGRRRECHRCLYDEMNKQCPNYHPIRLIIYDVKEGLPEKGVVRQVVNTKEMGIE